MALLGCLTQFAETGLLIPVNTPKPQEEPFLCRQTADNVVRSAKGELV